MSDCQNETYSNDIVIFHDGNGYNAPVEIIDLDINHYIKALAIKDDVIVGYEIIEI